MRKLVLGDDSRAYTNVTDVIFDLPHLTTITSLSCSSAHVCIYEIAYYLLRIFSDFPTNGSVFIYSGIFQRCFFEAGSSATLRKQLDLLHLGGLRSLKRCVSLSLRLL